MGEHWWNGIRKIFDIPPSCARRSVVSRAFPFLSENFNQTLETPRHEKKEKKVRKKSEILPKWESFCRMCAISNTSALGKKPKPIPAGSKPQRGIIRLLHSTRFTPGCSSVAAPLLLAPLGASSLSTACPPPGHASTSTTAAHTRNSTYTHGDLRVQG